MIAATLLIGAAAFFGLGKGMIVHTARGKYVFGLPTFELMFSAVAMAGAAL